MKRREFLKYAVLAPVAVAWACRGGGLAGGEPKEILGRTELMRFDGLTSMHEHVDGEKGADILLEAMDRTGIARMLLLGAYASILHGSATPDWESAAASNDLLLGLAARNPGRFTVFTLMDGREADPVAALEACLARGARGVKMYNGVANAHRAMPIDAPPLVPLLRFCELHGVPILVHVDGPNLDEFLRVARDHPAIPWICPHLFVQTKPDRIERLAQILRKYPNVHTDMSFGFEGWMHANLTSLSESRDRVREIFVHHADQIFFGTDVVMATDSPHRTVDWAANSFAEYRKFLEFDRFHHEVRGRSKVYEGEIEALALPDDVLRRIYVDNPARFLGRPAARTDRDDLDTVLRLLPAGARLEDGGRQALLAVAAVATLSPLSDLRAGLPGGPAVVAVPRMLAEAVARKLGGSLDSYRVLEDARAVRDLVAADPSAAGILPIDDLDPRLRALPLAGIDPAQPQVARCAAAGEATRAAYFGEYPLLLPLVADEAAAAGARFDPHELRTVLLTGCTLLGQGMVETPTRPPAEAAEGMAPITRAADIAHVSVENAAVAGCMQDLADWEFCYEPECRETLDWLGVDVIELSGNHLTDFGRKNLSETLSAYGRAGYPHFAGGTDLDDALRPAVLEIRGLRIGFTGINRLNSETSGAGPDRPGPLTPGDGNLARALALAREGSDVFFFSYHGGYELSALPWNDLITFAHAAVDAGAAGAIGVHPHMPMGVEVYDGAFVGYGLGNFLFRHPASAVPHGEMSERGIVLRMSLYGRRLLQAAVIPFESDDGRPAPSEGARAEATLDRVRRASRRGLAPERALPDLADASIELARPDSFSGPGRVQLKLGLTGQLLGLTAAAARRAGSSAEALRLLQEAVTTNDRWRSPGLRIALPLLDGWTLPDRGYDAVRLVADADEAATERAFAVAIAAGKPVQIPVAGPERLPMAGRLLQSAPGATVLVSGLATLARSRADLAALLRRNANALVDTSGLDDDGFQVLFAELSGDVEGWRSFFVEFQDRVLLATGASSDRQRLKWDVQSRLLRALRWALEDEEFRVPLPDPRNEWAGYPYEDEPTARGLALPPAVVDAIVGGNYRRVLGAA